MYKFALIGYPLSHSMSSVIHEAAMKDLGLEGSYEILETPPEDLVPRIKYLKSNGYNGFNITIPHKVPMIMFLDTYDKNVNLAGSVNTVKISDKFKMEGYNTDTIGFKNAISKKDQMFLKGGKVAILGLGGACRGAVVALNEIGVKKINFYVRNILNAGDAVESMRNSFPNIRFEVYQMSTMNDLADVSMLVNTTPVGMKNHSADLMPITKYILSSLDKTAIVYDIIYNPVKTNLINTAKELGYKIKIDTNGTLPEKLRALIEDDKLRPDFIAMDIKTSPSRYSTLICGEASILYGKSDFFEKVLKESAELVAAYPADCREWRTVLVPGLVTKEDIEQMAKLLPKDASWQFAQFMNKNCLDPSYNDIYPYTDQEAAELIDYAKQLIEGANLR